MTPGPWKVSRNLGIVSCDGERIVCLTTGSETDPDAIADARLIAAAPEMLEALRGFAADWPDLHIARNVARAILAKVEGGQK